MLWKILALCVCVLVLWVCVIVLWVCTLNRLCVCVFCLAGLRAGDEILHLNEKAAAALELSDMQAAFALPSLSLSVSTLPAIEPRHLCQRPPRRAEHDDTALSTDIFSQNQGEPSAHTPSLPYFVCVCVFGGVGYELICM